MAAAETDLAVAADPADVPTEARAEPPGATGMWELFLGLALLMVGNGLNSAVIGVRTGLEGFGVGVTGVIMAGYFAGFLISPSVVVKMIPRVGHIRVFAGLASTASSAVLIHSIAVEPAVWAAMRFVFGFCAAGLFIVIESWLNELTPNHRRGRTLAIYMIVSMGGLAVGQLLLSTANPADFTLFVVASILVSMSLVPVALASNSQPPIRWPVKVTIRELAATVPTGAVGAVTNGAAVGALLGMGAVYASRVGLSVDRTALFLAAPMVGAIVLQWPVGWISDRVSRRAVIFAVASGAVVVSGLLAVIPADNVSVLFLMVLLGGCTYPLYSLVVSYTLDWTPAAKTVGMSGALVRLSGAGAVLGPLLAASTMALDTSFYFWTLVASNAVMVSYVGYRIIAKDALPLERQRGFLIVPARASEFVMRLAPRPRRQRTG